MIEIKELSEINELIANQIEENLHLDYKAAHALGKSDAKKRKFLKMFHLSQTLMEE